MRYEFLRLLLNVIKQNQMKYDLPYPRDTINTTCIIKNKHEDTKEISYSLGETVNVIRSVSSNESVENIIKSRSNIL